LEFPGTETFTGAFILHELVWDGLELLGRELHSEGLTVHGHSLLEDSLEVRDLTLHCLHLLSTLLLGSQETQKGCQQSLLLEFQSERMFVLNELQQSVQFGVQV
jgi:hypothetical protein